MCRSQSPTSRLNAVFAALRTLSASTKRQRPPANLMGRDLRRHLVTVMPPVATESVRSPLFAKLAKSRATTRAPSLLADKPVTVLQPHRVPQIQPASTAIAFQEPALATIAPLMVIAPRAIAIVMRQKVVRRRSPMATAPQTPAHLTRAGVTACVLSPQSPHSTTPRRITTIASQNAFLVRVPRAASASACRFVRPMA